MDRLRLWFARLALVYAAAALLMLSYLYMLNPRAGIGRFGIKLDGSPHSVTVLRTSLGTMFLAMGLAAADGLARPRFLRMSLIFLVLLMSCIVLARLVGLTLDGVSAMQ
jgi:hypothetical protein